MQGQLFDQLTSEHVARNTRRVRRWLPKGRLEELASVRTVGAAGAPRDAPPVVRVNVAIVRSNLRRTPNTPRCIVTAPLLEPASVPARHHHSVGEIFGFVGLQLLVFRAKSFDQPGTAFRRPCRSHVLARARGDLEYRRSSEALVGDRAQGLVRGDGLGGSGWDPFSPFSKRGDRHGRLARCPQGSPVAGAP